MQVITIKFKDNKESQFLLDLLQRLNIKFDWREEKNPLQSKDTDAIGELFGSWPSDKSSDELIKMIYEARVNQTN